jgi:ligand-binding sensor domain-containing protein/serine phosphatase RsbU (regulator of sigma subunit)
MLSRHKISLLLALVLNVFYSEAQFSRFRHVTADNGLSDNTVYAIVQDSKGFIWCGTENGINKYDGYNVTSYPFNPEDSTGISAAQVRALLIDKNDKLWIGTFRGGLCCLDLKTNRFKSWKPDSLSKNGISSDLVNSILEVNDSILALGTSKGLDLFNRNTQAFTVFTHSDNDANSMLADYCRGLGLDKEGNIYIGHPGKGMSKFIPSQKKFTRIVPGATNRDLTTANLRNIMMDRDGLLWISLWNTGMNILDTKTGIIHSNIRDTNALVKPVQRLGLVFSFYEDRSGNIWFATAESGICRLNKKTGEAIYFKNNPDDSESFGDNTSFCVFEDRKGLVWGGTWRGGMSCFNASSLQFGHFKHEKNAMNTLPNNSVYTLAEMGNNEVAIGTGASISVFNTLKKTFTPFYMNPKDDGSLLVNSQVTGILKDRAGTYWITSGGGGLYHYFPDKKDYKNYVPYENPNALLTDNELQMALDKNDDLWIACPQGLHLYNKEKDNFSRFTHEAGNPNSIPTNNILCIASDKKGNVWLGSEKHGLILLNPNKREFAYFYNETKQKSSGGLSVLFIYPDSKNTLWLITSDGLLRMDTEKRQVENITDKNSLFGNTTMNVIEDKMGMMWITTEKGLVKYDPQGNEGICFFEKDGLQGKNFYLGCQLRLSDGSILLGGANGFNYFKPENIKADTSSPGVAFTGFQVLNKTYPLPQETAYTKEIDLTYRDYFFSVDFAAIDFADPSQNRFQYKLMGFNDDWVNIDQQHSITFTNLDPGTYTLQIKAATRNERWSEKPLEIKISISPPFWKTKWFYLLCIVSGLLILYGYIRWREKQLLIEKQTLETKVTARTEELRIEKMRVEEAHKDIKDSILYAQKIQSAILPSEDDFRKLLPDSFILFRPKDIVSGDFYWISEHGNHLFFAIGDCTGHGVPGGFMTMLGSGLLNELVNEHGVSEPAEILNKLRDKIIISLKQTGRSGENKDGMDLVLMRLDRSNNQLCYAAANNGFILIREGKITEYSGDKQPVGIYGDEIKPFSQHKIYLQKGDSIYSFTDGYPDQFGGSRGKKFKYRPLNELLLSISHLQPYYQKEKLEKTFTDWKGDLEQVDDVCIIGIKL